MHRLQVEIERRFKDAADHEAQTRPSAHVRYPVARQSIFGGKRLLTVSAGLLASSAAALALDMPWLVAGTGIALGLFGLAGLLQPATTEKAHNSLTPDPPEADENHLDAAWQLDEVHGQTGGLFDALGDMFVTIDTEGRIFAFNQTFAKATGQGDATGMTLAQVGITPIETDSGYQVRLSTNGETRIWAWRQASARQPRQNALVTCCIGRDITQEQQNGAALREAHEKAEAASKAKTRFLATVSHEIRTPLNGILGMTHLLSQTDVTREQASYLKTVRESGHSLMSMIEDLLDATSIEAGHFHLRRAQCNPRDLVQASCELMAAQAHEKGIEIASHVGFDVPAAIETDPGRIKQILFNLIGNAIKFTSEGGIAVKVERHGSQLAFHVRDTGPGLKPEDHSRIFEEFERADNSSTRRHGGAGLGLAISSRIVTALGGEISVQSAPGEGSCFTFKIPLNTDNEGEAPEFAREPLARKIAIILAADGPVSETLKQDIQALGGIAELAASREEAEAALRVLGPRNITDLIIDRRIALSDPALVESTVAALDERVGRTLIIAPEDSRDLKLSEELAAGKWLVRPIRAASLVNVLTLGDDRAERHRASNVISTPSLLRPSDIPTYDILLAEDNPVNALIVRTMLARDGHRVTLVENGLDLLEASLDRPDGLSRFDLVITDISMPELDGREAIKEIRATEAAQKLPRLPILVLSADGQAETRDEMLMIGADGHAEKPVDPDWLSSIVTTAAAKGRKSREK